MAADRITTALIATTTPQLPHTREADSVPLLGPVTQRHFGGVFARLLCSAGITNENEFQFIDSPTPRISNDVTFGHAHTLCSAILWLLW